jgi:antitoxin component YwqK of YwqJK toxin-antitoxin module
MRVHSACSDRAHARPSKWETRFEAISRTDLAITGLGLMGRGIEMSVQRTTWFMAIGAGVLFGCSPVQQSLPYAPVFNTGARATIIAPGQSLPPMQGQRSSSSSSSGQGSQSSSSTGGYPGQANGAPPPGTPPSAYGSGGEFTSLGGALTVDTREIEQPRNSLGASPIFWPFAIVAWPFEKLAEVVQGKSGGPSRSQTLSERADAIVESGGAPITDRRAQTQQNYERDEVQAMQQELERRQGGDGSSAGAAPTSVATTQTAGGGTLSIADELAALRNRGPRDSAAPATSGGSASIPGSAPADGAEDREGDGRADHWVFESGGDKTREVFDDDGDGRADRTLYYEAGGERVSRIEQDTDADGTPDSWVLNENGKLSQRRADTNHDGQVDSWTFYDERGQIIRQAQDLDGDGSRDRAELFENGKIARRTEDLDGDGQPDRTTRFDAQGNQTELEEDKDGDGQIDVKSYYADGRLVKREILDESAEGATP